MRPRRPLLGWLVGAVIVICDGQVWSELGAALPGSGGSYRFLREAYGPNSWGRLMAFLFIWQFVLSGPLEIASGMIGFGQYAAYIWPGLAAGGHRLVAAAVGVLAVIVLARRITSLGRITVTLWLGTLATLVAVIATGLPRFNAARAFDFPPGLRFQPGYVLGLEAAQPQWRPTTSLPDVCYIGDGVRPGRVNVRFSITIHRRSSWPPVHASGLIGTRLPAKRLTGLPVRNSSSWARLALGRGVRHPVMILWTASGPCSRSCSGTRASPTPRR